MSDVQVDVGSGIWHCERDAHSFDEPLANALAQFFLDEKAQSIVDVGCGSGQYVSHFRNSGLNCIGYDGNPKTYEFNAACFVHDILSDKRYDNLAEWALCLEVGEHIPPEHESKFLEVLTHSCSGGIVLSWFPTEGHGIGHFNPKSNEYVKAKMAERGFKSDEEAQEKLRKVATLWWFLVSLMVFKRCEYVASQKTVETPPQPFNPEDYSGKWIQ